MTLSEKLLQLRTARGLSQGDLAEKLEVSRQSVSKWETGQSVPDLDKIIKLAGLYGITVDELVREGERPQPPKPEPQVVYVKETHPLTRTQMVGACVEGIGVGLALVGLMGEESLLAFLGMASVLLGLPLLLAKKHPWLGIAWMAVAISWVVLNPWNSITPMGLWGGIRLLMLYITVPEIRYFSYRVAIFVAIGRGVVTLALIAATWLAWKRGKKDG